MRPDATAGSGVAVALEVRQIFEFTDEDGSVYEWDATAGRRLAEARGAPRDLFSLVQNGATPEKVKESHPALDEVYARLLPRAALGEPLLFAPFKGKAVLIDGCHRLMRAALDRVPELPAILLTEEEADAVLVSYRPPASVSRRRKP